MATASLRSESGMPSPLEVDLALARVDLAALRARRGKELGQQDQLAASVLERYYLRKLHAARHPVPIISSTLVPNEQTRRALEDGLASMAKAKLGSVAMDEELVSRFIELLRTLARTAHLEPDEGKELHTALHSLEARRPEPLPALP